MLRWFGRKKQEPPPLRPVQFTAVARQQVLDLPGPLQGGQGYVDLLE